MSILAGGGFCYHIWAFKKVVPEDDLSADARTAEQLIGCLTDNGEQHVVTTYDIIGYHVTEVYFDDGDTFVILAPMLKQRPFPEEPETHVFAGFELEIT